MTHSHPVLTNSIIVWCSQVQLAPSCLLLIRSWLLASVAPEVCVDTGGDAIAAVDPLRVTVGVQHLGMTGTEVSQKLEEEFAVVAELATQQVAAPLLHKSAL